MDNARKKYVNIERLFSGDIFALLDSVENENEGDIENLKNDSDAEFVAEDESVISTYIIRKEKIGDQESVPEASTSILSTQSEDKTNILGQDEPNSDPASQGTSYQSRSPANQRTVNRSPTAAT